MTSSNLDLVRSICAAWERGDFGSTDWADPEIEWVSREGPAPDRRAGLAEMRTGYREFLHDWENLRWETEECRVLDAGRVLVLGHYSGRGKRSGVEVGQLHTKSAAVLDIRDGKVTRLVLYWNRERALADLGLEPEGGFEVA
jgi:ketosteroid isomerase-like protein